MGPSLVEIIANKLDSGVLPKEPPAKVYAGLGAGAPCSACEDPILPTLVQYEFTVDQRTFRLHFGCFSLWEAECRRRGWRTWR
jgi:hypothetical protein